MPAKPDGTLRCPYPSSRKGAASCTTPSRSSGHSCSRRPASAPRRNAIGARTSAPTAVRVKATTGTARSRMAIAVSMNEPPHMAATIRSRIHERRLTARRSIAAPGVHRGAVRFPGGRPRDRSLAWGRMSFETAIHQWREGERRLDEASADQRAALERVTTAIQRELRRKLGGSFTTDELADLYDAGTDWTLDLAAQVAPR